jgi:hypothetical protein
MWAADIFSRAGATYPAAQQRPKAREVRQLVRIIGLETVAAQI